MSIHKTVSTIELRAKRSKFRGDVQTVRRVSRPAKEALRCSLAGTFLDAIAGAKTGIGTENAIDFESLSVEFHFVELGRWVGTSFRSIRQWRSRD
jgi:hypothetical protein